MHQSCYCGQCLTSYVQSVNRNGICSRSLIHPDNDGITHLSKPPRLLNIGLPAVGASTNPLFRTKGSNGCTHARGGAAAATYRFPVFH